MPKRDCFVAMLCAVVGAGVAFDLGVYFIGGALLLCAFALMVVCVEGLA